jgi:hypothetical protein
MNILFSSIETTGHLHPPVPPAPAGALRASSTSRRASGRFCHTALHDFGSGPTQSQGFCSDRSSREAVRFANVNMEGRSIQEQNAPMGRYWVLGEHLIERVHDLINLASVW